MSEQTQTILGGIFGILSIIAIIYQMSLSGYDKNSVAGAVQGIAGTMLNVMVLFLIFKNFYNKKTNNFEDRLKNKLEQYSQLFICNIKYNQYRNQISKRSVL